MMSGVMVYVWLAVGFFLLVKGADYFVEASSSIARVLRVPGIIIGLTIVAFGTSAPELAVSTAASLSGNNDIALGNVIGSNIFNLLVVLGACGVIRPFAVTLRWDFLASIGVAVVALGLLFNHNVSRVEGLILLVLFVVFVVAIICDAMSNRMEAAEDVKNLSPIRSAVYIIGGLAVIILGGKLVVGSATAIAESFGISENLIGLTIVAMGTSLPELVTSVVASRKGQNGLALGNVVGSNIFNILMVLGLSATLSPITVAPYSVIDTICLIVFSIIGWFLCRSKHRIGRGEGLIMLGMYAAYMIYICIR